MAEIPAKEKYLGDTWDIPLSMKRGVTPVDFRGWTIFFSAKADVDKPDSEALFKDILAVSSGAADPIYTPVVAITPAMTAGKEAGSYTFVIRGRAPDNKVYTLYRNTLILTRSGCEDLA